LFLFKPFFDFFVKSENFFLPSTPFSLPEQSIRQLEKPSPSITFFSFAKKLKGWQNSKLFSAFCYFS